METNGDDSVSENATKRQRMLESEQVIVQESVKTNHGAVEEQNGGPSISDTVTPNDASHSNLGESKQLNSSQQIVNQQENDDNRQTSKSRVETESTISLQRQVSTGSIDTQTSAAPKRAKIRARAVQPKDVLDLAPPELPPLGRTNSFNVSEIIRGFLYIGAGYDPSNRVVTNLPNDGSDATLRAERLAWFQDHHVGFALNMAGSVHQKETFGLSYPTEDSLCRLALDVNDVEEWQPSMTEAFDAAAEFMEKAFREHCEKKTAVFVHCVAGVNRSPFAVVWWLCKYHKLEPENAWELVRRRRDAGVNWINQTLGGPVNDEKPCGKIKWFQELKSRFSTT